MSLAKLDLRTAALPVSTEADEDNQPDAWTTRFLPVASGLCLLIVDAGLIIGAFLLAYWTRFVAPDDRGSALALDEYVRMGAFVAFGTAFLFAVHGFHDPDSPRDWAARLNLVVSALSTSLVGSLAVSHFIRHDQSFSRLWFAESWVFAVVCLSVWRGLAQRLYGVLRSIVAPDSRVLVVGANELGSRLAHELQQHYQVVGFVDNGVDAGLDLALLGPIAKLEQLVEAFNVDEVVIALPSTRREQVSRIIARGFRRRVVVKIVPELNDLLPERVEVHNLAGRSYIGFSPVARVTWLKRAVDLVVTAGGLAVLLVPLAFIALAIKLDSPGPVFYRQRRVGKDGRLFWMLKFRSMRRDADMLLAALREQNEASGPLFKMRADPRVTRVGRVLRRLSLDELPQLLNVMRGEMSLVGPRPPLPSEVAEYEDWQFGRLRTTPGITGLWQVSGRSEVPFHDMVRLDLHYIRNWSLSLDIEILLRTIPAVLTSRGAY